MSTGHPERLAELGRAMHTATDALEQARQRLRAAIVAAVKDGMSESEAARQAGVDRMTVRHALGKR